MFITRLLPAFALSSVVAAQASTMEINLKDILAIQAKPCSAQLAAAKETLAAHQVEDINTITEFLTQIERDCEASGTDEVTRNADEDTTPPELKELTFLPQTVSVNEGEVDLKVTAKFFDESERVSVMMYLRPPAQYPDVPLKHRYTWATFTTDEPNIFEAPRKFTFDENDVAGEWSVNFGIIIDEHRNRIWRLPASDIEALGINPYITIENDKHVDAYGPQIQSITLSDTEVDLNSGDKTVTVTLIAMDEANSITGGIRIHPPEQYPDAPNKEKTSLTWQPTGNANEFKAQTEVLFKDYDAKGEWLFSLILRDEHGNEKDDITAQQLAELGINNKITVKNNAFNDYTAPKVHSIELAQSEITLTQRQQTVTVKVQLYDESNFVSARVELSPTDPNTTVRSKHGSDLEWQATSEDNIFEAEATFVFEHTDFVGQWGLSLIRLRDAYNNDDYSQTTQELENAGFDPYLQVNALDTVIDYHIAFSDDIAPVKVGEATKVTLDISANEGVILPKEFRLTSPRQTRFYIGCGELLGVSEYKVTHTSYNGVDICKYKHNDDVSEASAELNFTLREAVDTSATVTFNSEFNDIDTSNNQATIAITALEAQLFSVKFVDWDGTFLLEQSVQYNHAATAPNISLTRVGYVFSGWDRALTNITENITIKATYDVIVYQVAFLDWDNKKLAEVAVAYGESAEFTSTPPTREGYQFIGWDKELSNVLQSFSTKAMYQVNEYTVTYVDWDGTELYQQTVTHGENASEPEMLPQREGYVFTKWDSTGKNITANTTITAQYQSLEVPKKKKSGGTMFVFNGCSILS